MSPLLVKITDLACSPVARLLVALVLTVALAVLLIGNRPIPDAYWALVGAVVGFYFGGHVGTNGG